MNSNRYSNRPIGYANTYPTARNGFVPGGRPGRECQECFAVGGHYTYCDKTK